jgi:cytochrome c biogenesis protein
MPRMNSLSDLSKALWLRLGSMSLAVVLLTVLSLASAIGTVLLQNQNQGDYLQQFGPLWYWVFRSLGMFDMYHTWWFMTLLGFLMVSLTACLWRHVPLMLKEMRTRKVKVAEKSLKRFKYLHRWTLKKTHTVASLEATFRKRLPGWEFKTLEENGQHYIRADKGRMHKWGYISVHAAILVILVGGWMSAQFSVRGNMSVAEGGKASEIFFLKGTDTVTMNMPFEVRCNSFDIEFFPTGQPKEFRSNLTIIDQGKEVLTSDIIVNEPLFYKGVRIYQASFGDGGSEVTFNMFHMDGSQKISTAKSNVYKTWEDADTGISIKVTDFKQNNVENMAEAGEPMQFQDIGPAVEYELRGPNLKPVKIKAFMEPFVDLEGNNRGSFFMVSMTGDSADYQSVGLGLDLTNPQEWELFHAFMKRMGEMGDKKSENASLEAFKKAIKDVFGDKPPKDFENMGMRTLNAVNMLPQLPWPILPMPAEYNQVYYTGLQLARDPGMNVVWIGSAILTIGLCIMFYMPHRKLWLIVRPESKKTHITLAGMATRNPIAFNLTFHDLLTKLEEDFTHPKS